MQLTDVLGAIRRNLTTAFDTTVRQIIIAVFVETFTFIHAVFLETN